MAFNPGKINEPGFKEWFAKYRFVQDEYADDVAVEIVHSPHYVEIFRAWAMIEKNSDPVNFSIPKVTGAANGECAICLSDAKHQLLIDKLNNYFRDTTAIDYMKAHMNEVRSGCEFFNECNANATLALVTRSLLKQYAAYNATNVLMFTKMIKDSPNRRILESMRFVRDVMDVDGYEPGGRAIRNIQKLRLVHAVIRARINAGKYDRIKFIEAIQDKVAKIAEAVHVIEAKKDDLKLEEIYRHIEDLNIYLINKIAEINKFNTDRKDKTKPPRTINERASDLKRSFDYLIEIQTQITTDAKWLEENTDGHNQITILYDIDKSITFPHFVNDLKRNAKEIEWNEAEWGNPINQQDMIFAVHTFSTEVLDGLIASGDDVSDQQKEDYYKTWHHIGHCLGVKDEINPDNYADGKRLQDIIYSIEFQRDLTNGKELTEPLLRFMKSILPFNSGTQIRAVIANYNDKSDYKIFKDDLGIDLDDIDELNLFNLKAATFLLKIIVFIRKFIKRTDSKYRYSSFILRHLGIVDQIDNRLTSKQRGTQGGVAFSGTDAEGDLPEEDKKANVNFPMVVLKSVLSKIWKQFMGMFKRKRKQPTVVAAKN